MRLGLLFLIMLTLSIAFASDKSKLIILSHAYFDNETDKNSVNYHLVKAIQPALGNEFHLKLQFTNHARQIKRLSSNEPSCTFNAIKTPERKQNMLFSTVPTFMHVQRQLFGLKNELKSKPSDISVEQLLHKNYIFGIIGSTSYQQLDKLFASNASNVAVIYGENPFLQLSNLLMNNRIDFIIGYQETLFAHLTVEQQSLIESRPIIELPKFINGYFACSKTPQGRRAMELMNNYMKTHDMAAYLKEIHTNNSRPEDTQAMLDIYTKTYGINFKNAPSPVQKTH
ncbi:transporter substrate-binding domain-containing protein (plasmid) [Pseudoalteromonas sp. CF6-2]|uniref:transporter substrate-binding domain-containing protein n=1 Tax=Pseudoalteromonas sp. CF6-2 TaxID=562716 RepID=UPI001F293815|nr:transporter substrate-binding domain-containing protein [Pseudoalteromonas sp. CF6-2]